MQKKTTTTALVILLIISAACSFGQSGPPGVGPTALILVMDTSWPCDRFAPEFRTLARQATGTLAPGDYLEILSARPSHPRVELAHTVRNADAAEAKAIDHTLESIRARFLTQASVANALETAFARLTEVSSKRDIGRVVVIVLSDGQLGRHQIPRMLTTADRFNKNGWSLYITGTRDTTRDLLVAANKGAFTWSSISEANPALWLDRKVDVPASRVSEGSKAAAVTTPAPPASGPQELSSVRAEPKEPALGPRRTHTPKEHSYSITTRIDAITSVGPLSEVPAGEKAELPAPVVLEPNQPTEAAAVAPPTVVSPQPPTDPQQPRWARLRGAIGRYWWLLPWAAVFTGLAFVVSRSIAQARRWDAKRQGHLAKGPSSDPGRLVVRYGEQSYQLGPLKQFRSAHIGPGAANTIRTPDTTPGERHVTIYRRGDNIILRNLAPAPILVNSLEVKPGGRRRLVIPSVIQLNNKTKLNLELVRPDPRSARPERSGDHERQVEPQLAG
jgi:hypothetical protein